MMVRALSSTGDRRLLGMLESYGRDELRLRVTNVFRLQGQPAQVTFEPVDAGGGVIRDRSGLVKRQTFQVNAGMPWLSPRQLVSLTREGESALLRVLSSDRTPRTKPGTH